MHARTHARTHAYTRVRALARTHTHTHTHTLLHTLSHGNRHTLAYDTQIHITNTHRHRQTDRQTHTHKHTGTYTHACARTRTFTLTVTQQNTYPYSGTNRTLTLILAQNRTLTLLLAQNNQPRKTCEVFITVTWTLLKKAIFFSLCVCVPKGFTFRHQVKLDYLEKQTNNFSFFFFLQTAGTVVKCSAFMAIVWCTVALQFVLEAV